MSELTELHELIRREQCSDLCKTRTCAVPGEGPDDAQIMFIGEAPGFNEDKTGRPFVGAAGQFLNKLLLLAGLQRPEVYITNVVKCRPPNNRDPLPTEIEACRTYLDRQIELIRPKVIVTLGRYSMSRWFAGESISRIHGQPRVVDGVTIVPMFHPAAALHQERYRALIEADFKQLPAILAAATAPPPAPPPVPASSGPPASGAAPQTGREPAPPSIQQMRLF